MPPNRFESEVESFLEGSHGDRTHIKRADHHTVTPLCGTLLRPARPGVGVSAKKFAQHTKNGPKMVLYGVLGEYFRGNAANSLTLGEFFRGRKLEGLVWVAGGQSPVFKPPRHPV